MDNRPSWHLADDLANVAHNDFKFEINLRQPELGATLQSGASLIGNVFCIEGLHSHDSLDAYIRGQDLIASYSADNQNPIDGDVYWRLNETTTQLLAVEMIYSLHTQLLDSRPLPLIGFQFNANETKTCSFRNLDDAALVKESAGELKEDNFCLASVGGDVELAIGTFPNDIHQLEIASEGDTVDLKFRLQSDFLEKGVIRRLRMLMAIAIGENAKEQLERTARGFVCSNLPLTT